METESQAQPVLWESGFQRPEREWRKPTTKLPKFLGLQDAGTGSWPMTGIHGNKAWTDLVRRDDLRSFTHSLTLHSIHSHWAPSVSSTTGGWGIYSSYQGPLSWFSLKVPFFRNSSVSHPHFWKKKKLPLLINNQLIFSFSWVQILALPLARLINYLLHLSSLSFLIWKMDISIISTLRSCYEK